MQANSQVGSIVKGGESVAGYTPRAAPFFWVVQAKRLDRMVRLGVQALQGNVRSIENRTGSPDDTDYVHCASIAMTTFMLASLAVENLLKASLLMVHPEYIRDGKFRGETISSHDLRLIAKDAGVYLSPDEEDFCELGTESILQFGRYPIAKNVTHTPTEIRVGFTAFDVYGQLYDRLVRYVQEGLADR
jgi:hypothetical protein